MTTEHAHKDIDPTGLPQKVAAPRGDRHGFKLHWKQDLVSGFFVFLIALPLCLGIAIASGFPPIAGIFTAIVGGLVTPFISDSELTIKGPAAGLIVIVIGAIVDFGGNGFADGNWTSADASAYRAVLAIGAATAVLQIFFGLLRGGILGEFFPASAVHGMLAAIGVIIIAKQFPVALGNSPVGEPIELLGKLPQALMHTNPAIGLIGLLSLAIMLVWPLVRRSRLHKIPAALVVLIVAIPLGRALGLNGQPRTYTFAGNTYELGPKFLVTLPESILSGISAPNLSVLTTPRAWYWVAMFTVIATLESLLSARAVDLIDPWRRRSNLNRDTAAVGTGNLIASLIGGLPMISEIVRSRSNADNGARTRFANLFHGLFLLAFVAFLPGLLSLIPLAALAAMLVYTGFRLAHPREFIHVYKIGIDEFVVFTATVIGVLVTDLLIGIGIGVGVNVVLALLGGTSPLALLRPRVRVVHKDDTVRLEVHDSIVFSGWLTLKWKIEKARSLAVRAITIDLSRARLIDHSAMVKLHDLRNTLIGPELAIVIAGLDHHQPVSAHPLAARRYVHRRT